VIQRPEHLGKFEFVILATLRAAQLMRGCIPMVVPGDHKATVIAQVEVAAGKIVNVGVGSGLL
jgi:DNA-directed RNA polymerase omega subunit